MKEVFQMLKDPRFHLVYGVTQRYSNGPEPRRVRLNREGYKLVEGVTKKALVYPRMRLAVHPSPLKGDAFSPIFGRITDVTERSLFVEAIEPDEALRALADGVEKVDLINDERTGQELAVLLRTTAQTTQQRSLELFGQELPKPNRSSDAIGLDEALDMVQRDQMILIDVRPPEEYEAGHIEHAVNIPLKNLEDYLQSQPPLVSAAAYCRSPYCFLAREAQRIFAAHGRRLLVVEDGMLDWKAGQSQKIVK